MILGDKVWKAFDRALETYSPHDDWQWLGESFRHQMIDHNKLNKFRAFLVGFSLADSRLRDLDRQEQKGYNE